MSISVQWGNDDKTIIYMLFEQEITIDDYLVASKEAAALLDSVEYKVDMILELQDVVIPKNVIGQFPRMKAGPHVSHPNFRFGVIVGVSGLADILLDIYAKVFISQSRYSRADTLEDAYAIIEGRRAT